MQICDSAVLKRYNTHCRMHQAVRRAIQHLHSSSHRKSRYSRVSAAAGPGNKSAVRTDLVTCRFLFTGKFEEILILVVFIEPRISNLKQSTVFLRLCWKVIILTEHYQRDLNASDCLQFICKTQTVITGKGCMKTINTSGQIQAAEFSIIWCSAPSKWQHVYFVKTCFTYCRNSLKTFTFLTKFGLDLKEGSLWVQVLYLPHAWRTCELNIVLHSNKIQRTRAMKRRSFKERKKEWSDFSKSVFRYRLD